MRKKLEMRKSAMQLIQMGRAGRVDSRSEIGSIVSIEEWLRRPDSRLHCVCEQVRDNEQFIPSHIMITDQHLYILRNTDVEGKLVIKARRKLNTIMKITTKAKMCEAVKLQYGSKGTDGVIHITDSDRFLIPNKAGLMIRTIKSILQPRSANPSPSRTEPGSTIDREHSPSRRQSSLSDSVLYESPFKSRKHGKTPLHSPLVEHDHEHGE